MSDVFVIASPEPRHGVGVLATEDRRSRRLLEEDEPMFKLEIETDNAAFDDPYHEIARILRWAAKRIEATQTDAGRLVDYNGNSVGSFEYKP
jgi:hypothetical protein